MWVFIFETLLQPIPSPKKLKIYSKKKNSKNNNTDFCRVWNQSKRADLSLSLSLFPLFSVSVIGNFWCIAPRNAFSLF
jgi:nitrate reductase NapE component